MRLRNRGNDRSAGAISRAVRKKNGLNEFQGVSDVYCNSKKFKAITNEVIQVIYGSYVWQYIYDSIGSMSLPIRCH